MAATSIELSIIAGAFGGTLELPVEQIREFLPPPGARVAPRVSGRSFTSTKACRFRKVAMPFNRAHAIAFTPSNIRSSVPNVGGVYGIFQGREWVFVGESEHLQVQLLAHSRDLTHEMHRHHPTHFVYELTQQRVPRRNELIRECGPRCNRQARQLAD